MIWEPLSCRRGLSFRGLKHTLYPSMGNFCMCLTSHVYSLGYNDEMGRGGELRGWNKSREARITIPLWNCDGLIYDRQ